MVKLRYVDTDTPVITFDGAGQYFRYNRYKINAAYDVNDAVLSTTMPGFNEYAPMYSAYQVIATKIRATFWVTLSHAVPMNVGIAMVRLPLTVGTSDEANIRFRGNPNAITSMLIPGQRKTLTLYRRIGSQLLGNATQYRGDQSYSSSTGGQPANLFYGYVAAFPVNTNVTPPSASIYVKTEVTMYIRFFIGNSVLSSEHTDDPAPE